MTPGPAMLSPEELQVAWGQDPALTYVDVRTVGEFCAGRPKGRAVNIPWEFHAPGGGAPHPNPAFVPIVETLFAPAARLVIGADAGPRALQAAQALQAAGYHGVSVLAGGIDAWRSARLLVSTDNRPGVSYVSLLTRYRRPAGAAATGH